jgi:hypothetical protein
MSHAPYITHPSPDRQIAAARFNLNVADHLFAASFETAVSRMWGIDERIRRADEGVVPAELTMLLTLKDRRTRYDTDAVKAIVRSELKRLVDWDGAWSKGTRPDVFAFEDVEVCGFEVIMMSRATWIVKVDLQATYDSNEDRLPLGWHEWMSSRGVR